MVVPVIGQNIQVKQDAAVGHINALSGNLRAKYITEIAGQQMVYLVKETEAEEYQVDPAPILANYPHIEAEIGITGVDAAAVASAFLANASLWRSISPQIETVRVGHLKQVTDASTVAEINAAVAGFESDLADLIATLS